MSEARDWAGESEQAVLDEALKLVPQRGWTWPTAYAAGRTAGLSRGEVELLLPHGPRDLAALLSRRHDQAALAMLAGVDPAALKVRERIRRAVEARLQAAGRDEAALYRWVGFLALPTRLPLALRLLWESADALWRWAGDTATDENHYTKRLILAEILASSLAIRLAEGQGAAMAHVDRRIEAVMAYERFKARVKVADAAASIATALGRIRYGLAR
ncbi:MAG: COQ9 family protein [Caulobacterales bacterium]